MTKYSELVARAKTVLHKGVQKNDGYNYSVPAADLAESNSVIQELLTELKETRRTARVNYALYKSVSEDLDIEIKQSEELTELYNTLAGTVRNAGQIP